MECKLFSPSTKFGSLGIIDPVTSAARSHNVSVHATAILTEAIKSVSILDLDSHVNAVLSARHHDAANLNQLFDSLLENLMVFVSVLSSMLKIRIFCPG